MVGLSQDVFQFIELLYFMNIGITHILKKFQQSEPKHIYSIFTYIIEWEKSLKVNILVSEEEENICICGGSFCFHNHLAFLLTSLSSFSSLESMPFCVLDKIIKILVLGAIWFLLQLHSCATEA